MPSDKFKLESATIAEGPTVVDMKENSLSTSKNFKTIMWVGVAVVVATGIFFTWRHFKKKSA